MHPLNYHRQFRNKVQIFDSQFITKTTDYGVLFKCLHSCNHCTVSCCVADEWFAGADVNDATQLRRHHS